ncbi:hypothetical protein Bca52824_027052 [Brassica carinata]|uniref:Uncharacterized protein n=1 Tax=Brassica carinata TaxID=52824 RepID=A0A8X7V9D8_BRACI|nr:hypothetical protein Bca52824_027052 [Brassica carinata]
MKDDFNHLRLRKPHHLRRSFIFSEISDSGQFTVEHNLNHDEVKNVINHGGISDSIPTYTWLARLPQLPVTPSSGVSKALNAERCGCHHSRGVSSFTESLKLRIRAASSSSTKYYDFTVIGSRVAVSDRETSVAYHTLQLDPVERRRKKKRGRKSSRQINYGC